MNVERVSARYVTSVAVVLIATLLVVGSVNEAPASVEVHAVTPSVICVPGYGRGNSELAYRKKPRVCNFLMRGAPVVHPALVLSHATRWHRWDSEFAKGTGRHFVNSGPRNGIPIKFWLENPITICGHTVFSTLRTRVRKLTYRPNAQPKSIYGRWMEWSDPIDIAVCPR